MTDLPLLVREYWRGLFERGTIIADSEAFSITVNSALNRERRVMILEYACGRARAALTPELASKVGVPRLQNTSTAWLRQQLASVGIVLHDPDFIFYLPEITTPARAGDPMHASRRLTAADREAFDTFKAKASEQDLEDAYVELDHWAVFGSFHRDLLVSAASAYPWDSAPIADLGVLTLPDFRSQGRARAVVRSICQFARDQGYEPQYRCQEDNFASVALATASGLALLGKWEVIESR